MCSRGRHHSRVPVGKPCIGRPCQVARRPLAGFSVREGAIGRRVLTKKIAGMRLWSGLSRDAFASMADYTGMVQDSKGGQTPLWAAVPLSLEGGASHRDEAMLSSRHSFAAIDPTRRALHALPQPSLTLPLRSPGGRPDRQSTNTHWASPFEEPLLIQTWSLQWRVHLIFKWVHVCLPMCRLHHIETL